METAKKHLSKGYDLLNAISVSGANVDNLALARQEFRAAFAALDKAQRAAEENKTEKEN